MVKHGYGIKFKPITVRNSQANTIVGSIHQVHANMICTLELGTDYLDIEDPWKGMLSATASAVRLTYPTTSKKTSGHLVFGKDMTFLSSIKPSRTSFK